MPLKGLVKPPEEELAGVSLSGEKAGRHRNVARYDVLIGSEPDRQTYLGHTLLKVSLSLPIIPHPNVDAASLACLHACYSMKSIISI